ncbi:hypothetical protein Pmani_032145 [Petrolisthes manimaculis]|uniref:Amine oxidase domain-containing protein n=1 Tax=Petrolisthes manimaculis TaxID=1843537 RepID=A0AAE1NT62_9EUCA|nr:hypothetical protein Pmani_036754 [Petrolisthes manimaculis]KAK4295283.1 hypothetical protein Pmani_032145 [Petrolisthes manimaculis]
MNSLPKHVRVCIIGGGVAGLGAAQQLIQSGVDDILLLEAQDRVGGRVFTLKHGKHYIELGAHWIHGEEGNVVHEWAAENGFIAEEASVAQTGYGETIFVRQDGKVVPQEMVDGFMKIAAKIQESGEEELKTYPHSVGHYYTEKFKAVNKWGIVGNELLEWKHRFLNCVNASASWHDLPGKMYLEYKECPGDPTVNWKQNGYQTLIDHLKEEIPVSRLALNSPVKCIDWDVTSTGAASGCKVTLESGTVVSADHVIFTASIGVLKAQKNMFSPSLPQRMIKAIEGIGFGVVGKLYLQFPHQWWDNGSDGFSFLPDLQEQPAVITKENWETGILGFYPVYKQQNMMCGWITGPTALAIEDTPECEVAERCVSLLRKVLSPKWTVPQANWCKRTTWGSNPYTRGSYSFYSMKSMEMEVEIVDLAQPLLDSKKNPVVCFAGEATHPCFFSTVHGALESGRREATRITQHINRLLMNQPKREKYQVIIVGGGAAGIGAARELTHHGINSVLILEGSDRVGGRIKTVPTPPQGVVELGAQWIHGEVGNVLHKVAASRGLLHHHLSLDGKGTFITENGQVINEDIVRHVSKVMEEADEECISFCDDIENNGNIEQLSVGEFFRRKFMQHLEECQNDAAEVREMKTALFYWHLRWQRIDNACDSLHLLSAKCWGLYELCEGNNNMNPNAGFMSIMETLLAEATTEVKLYSEVSCIDYAHQVQKTEDGYVRQDGTTFPVLIKCRDGSEYEAQHVIVTSSIGYLKSHPHLFTPPLPTKLQQTVSSRGYGTIDKIFLEYDEAWWVDGCEGIQLVWTKDIPDVERLSPQSKYIDGTNEKLSKYWVHAISGFDPVFNHPARLCGWIGGTEAEYMESLSDHQIGTDCTLLLRKFLPHTDIPYPKKVYRSQWATNPLSCGGYSYHNVGCLCCSGAPDADLDFPVSAFSDDDTQVPVVVLAGEANSKKFYSTVHGALQNGIQQAAHFIKSHKRLHGSIKSKM